MASQEWDGREGGNDSIKLTKNSFDSEQCQYIRGRPGLGEQRPQGATNKRVTQLGKFRNF